MSKLKLLKTTTYYKSYLDEFYKENYELISKSYELQYNTIMGDCYAWSDFWKQHIEESGNYEVIEIIVNAEKLQKQWAKENNVNYNTDDWKFKILEAQIKYFKPDVWFDHSSKMPSVYRQQLMHNMNYIKLIIGYDGVARHCPIYFGHCDIMLSCLPGSVDFYRQKGFESYLIKLGFEDSILSKLVPAKTKSLVSFIGTATFTKMGHYKRIELLDKLSSHLDLSLWLGKLPNNLQLINYLSKAIVARDWKYFLKITKSLKSVRRLKKINKGHKYGLKMYQALANSAITLNSHIESAGSMAANLRLFEATGTGSCLVTDWKKNIKDYFEIDNEIVTYKCNEECVEKVEYLLEHEDVRMNIAKAGQKRTLNDHTLRPQIIMTINEILEKHYNQQ